MTEPLAIPILTGGRLILRAHGEADIDAVFERAVDPACQRWTTVPLEYTRELARQYVHTIGVERPDEVSWAIECDGRYAGTIDLRQRGGSQGHGAGGLGFATHQDVRGRGVMSEAVTLVLDYAFGGLGWELVQWEANVGNYGSYKAVWRNGFPLPVAVPALLDHRGVMTDGWHSTLWRGDPRAPQLPWEQAYAALQAQVRQARRPG